MIHAKSPWTIVSPATVCMDNASKPNNCGTYKSNGAITIPPPIPSNPERKPVTRPRHPTRIRISTVLDNRNPGRPFDYLTHHDGMIDTGGIQFDEEFIGLVFRY